VTVRRLLLASVLALGVLGGSVLADAKDRGYAPPPQGNTQVASDNGGSSPTSELAEPTMYEKLAIGLGMAGLIAGLSVGIWSLLRAGAGRNQVDRQSLASRLTSVETRLDHVQMQLSRLESKRGEGGTRSEGLSEKEPPAESPPSPNRSREGEMAPNEGKQTPGKPPGASHRPEGGKTQPQPTKVGPCFKAKAPPGANHAGTPSSESNPGPPPIDLPPNALTSETAVPVQTTAPAPPTTNSTDMARLASPPSAEHQSDSAPNQDRWVDNNAPRFEADQPFHDQILPEAWARFVREDEGRYKGDWSRFESVVRGRVQGRARAGLVSVTRHPKCDELAIVVVRQPSGEQEAHGLPVSNSYRNVMKFFNADGKNDFDHIQSIQYTALFKPETVTSPSGPELVEKGKASL
jgi:hypothetical protein